MATKARKSGRKTPAKKTARGKAAAKRTAASRGGAKRRPAAKKKQATTRKRPVAKRRQSPVARVKRVTQGVVQQATAAVSTGVETIRDFGENLIERVRQD